MASSNTLILLPGPICWFAHAAFSDEKEINAG
jgi:hypothetical protein